MLYKRIIAIQPHLENEDNHGHTNFILEFLYLAKEITCRYFAELHSELRPHMHDLLSYVAAGMYKISSAAAQEFLRFYNFVQGRKKLKSNAVASSFIRDIAVNKEEATTKVVRMVRKRTSYQTQMANK